MIAKRCPAVAPIAVMNRSQFYLFYILSFSVKVIQLLFSLVASPLPFIAIKTNFKGVPKLFEFLKLCSHVLTRM